MPTPGDSLAQAQRRPRMELAQSAGDDNADHRRWDSFLLVRRSARGVRCHHHTLGGLETATSKITIATTTTAMTDAAMAALSARSTAPRTPATTAKAMTSGM